MQTRLIPEDEWAEFADRFSRDHTGWYATVLVLHPKSGPLTMAENLPLQGISFDTKGTRPGSIAVSVGETPSGHIRHVVDLPLYIREVDQPDGSIDLQLEPGNGPPTLIHLSGPVH